MRQRTRAEQKAIERQRRGKGLRALPLETPVERTAPRTRTSTKAGAMQGADDPRYRNYRWKQLRNRRITERKDCQGECGGYWPAKYADHIVEVRDDTSDENFFDEANLGVPGTSASQMTALCFVHGHAALIRRSFITSYHSVGANTAANTVDDGKWWPLLGLDGVRQTKSQLL